ncbi:sulfite exporter TauE/SafE family protein [Solicola sp. PLA-1-18]|uniref:sulfite exporter TauE/SafE family protein n=1 Tax=Solicola sp. PLA-1-18 TaxID=3380532 RepID=UPI003B821846
MELLDVLAVLGAGLAAGIVITAVGAGSLISFPILLGVGLPPVVANVSNTVGLVAGGVTGSWGYRHELVGQGRRVRQVALTSAVGALGGAALLLVLPPGAFEAVVPVLVLTAAVLIGVQPLISRWLRARRTEVRPTGGSLSPALLTASSVMGVYGGYFGAAQGVVLVAFLALGLDEPMQLVNGLKNVAVLSANVAGSLVFVLAAPVDWGVVGLLTVGSLVGGWVGAKIGRRLPAWVFRTLVVAMGLVVGLRLLLT